MIVFCPWVYGKIFGISTKFSTGVPIQDGCSSVGGMAYISPSVRLCPGMFVTVRCDVTTFSITFSR